MFLNIIYIYSVNVAFAKQWQLHHYSVHSVKALTLLYMIIPNFPIGTMKGLSYLFSFYLILTRGLMADCDANLTVFVELRGHCCLYLDVHIYLKAKRVEAESPPGCYRLNSHTVRVSEPLFVKISKKNSEHGKKKKHFKKRPYQAWHSIVPTFQKKHKTKQKNPLPTCRCLYWLQIKWTSFW